MTRSRLTDSDEPVVGDGEGRGNLGFGGHRAARDEDGEKKSGGGGG